jgi:hypothetical protein
MPSANREDYTRGTFDDSDFKSPDLSPSPMSVLGLSRSKPSRESRSPFPGHIRDFPCAVSGEELEL